MKQHMWQKPVLSLSKGAFSCLSLSLLLLSLGIEARTSSQISRAVPPVSVDIDKDISESMNFRSKVECCILKTLSNIEALLSCGQSIIIRPQDLPYVITQPGVYCLEQDTSYSPTTLNPAITVTTSNVRLNLNNRILSQGNTNPGIIGVLVQAGAENVKIYNGYIYNFSLWGIKYQDETNDAAIISVTTKGNGYNSGDTDPSARSGGIQFLGTEGSINRVLLKDVSSVANSATDNICNGLDLEFVNIILCENCNFNENTSTGPETEGVHCSNVADALFENCLFNRNLAPNGSAWGLFGVSFFDAYFEDCQFDSNSGANGGRGFHSVFAGTTVANNNFYFIDCTASQNAQTDPSLNERAIGFDIDTFSHRLFMINCEASGNSCASTGSAFPPNGAAGFLLSDVSNGHLINCQALDNVSPASGLALGFLIINQQSIIASRGSALVFDNCISSGQRGFDAGVGFSNGVGLIGAFTSPYPGIIFRNCVAENNVALPANGIGAGFLLQNMPRANILNCIVKDNGRDQLGVALGSGIGIQLEIIGLPPAFPTNFCMIEENLVSGNTTFGFIDNVPNSRNVYKRNESFNNGPLGNDNYNAGVIATGSPIQIWQMPNPPSFIAPELVFLANQDIRP